MSTITKINSADPIDSFWWTIAQAGANFEDVHMFGSFTTAAGNNSNFRKNGLGTNYSAPTGPNKKLRILGFLASMEVAATTAINVGYHDGPGIGLNTASVGTNSIFWGTGDATFGTIFLYANEGGASISRAWSLKFDVPSGKFPFYRQGGPGGFYIQWIGIEIPE